MVWNSVRARPLLAVVLLLVSASCGGGSDDGTAQEAVTTTTTAASGGTSDTSPPGGTDESPAASSTTTTTSAGSGGGGLITDASGVDWATVDLTSIDWANIDMSQIDWAALETNPTAVNLEAETVALIQSRIDPGSATLTIGDQTWEFASFLCAFGHAATESAVYSFSSSTFGEHEGARVQMQADIRDDSGQGRYEGSDLEHLVYIRDISDFDNPSIDFEMTGPDGIVVDGNTITASGTFDDRLTEGDDQIPGTLDATCATQSRR